MTLFRDLFQKLQHSFKDVCMFSLLLFIGLILFFAIAFPMMALMNIISGNFIGILVDLAAVTAATILTPLITLSAYTLLTGVVGLCAGVEFLIEYIPSKISSYYTIENTADNIENPADNGDSHLAKKEYNGKTILVDDPDDYGTHAYYLKLYNKSHHTNYDYETMVNNYNIINGYAHNHMYKCKK